MNTSITFGAPRRVRFSIKPNRAIVAMVLLALAIAPGELGSMTRSLMTDAFVQVSSFVSATLLLFYGSERLFKYDIGQALKGSKGWQVPLAALLGATPGCGGAVVVVAAYASGNVGFGAVVATLTATMGDAAFLLIATRPDAALVVLPLSFSVGILSGWIVDRLPTLPMLNENRAVCDVAPFIGKLRARDLGYLVIAAPGLGFGILQLTGADLGLYAPWTLIAGMTGTAIGLAIWVVSPVKAMTNAKDSPLTRMAEETSFISVWVIGAYLAYDYVVTFAGIDLASLFQSIAPLLPLIGVAIGLVPGCGPQVLVATLYINGLIPFAALMGNAISNDGDALFPAIALTPRAAILATVYSTIPALIVGYGFYILAPGFLN